MQPAAGNLAVWHAAPARHCVGALGQHALARRQTTKTVARSRAPFRRLINLARSPREARRPRQTEARSVSSRRRPHNILGARANNLGTTNYLGITKYLGSVAWQREFYRRPRPVRRRPSARLSAARQRFSASPNISAELIFSASPTISASSARQRELYRRPRPAPRGRSARYLGSSATLPRPAIKYLGTFGWAAQSRHNVSTRKPAAPTTRQPASHPLPPQTDRP